MGSVTGFESFAADLREEVLSKSLDGEVGRFREEAFTEYVVGLLYERGFANDAEVCHAEIKGAGSKPAGKISAWALSADGTTLDLFVSLYHGHPVEETVALGKTELEKQLNLGLGFLRRSLDGVVQSLEESSPGFLAAKAIHEARETIVALNVYFLTDGLARSQDIDEESKLGDMQVHRHVWDIEKLSRIVGTGGHEPIRIDFTKEFSRHGGSVACLARNDKLGAYQTYLAFFPGTLLAEIYGRHGQRLLERNVRAFLQAKGKVNKGLQRTLRDEANWFLAYNNGLCCTAAKVGVREARNGHALLDWAEDFQIVNGGQTTASIYHALKDSKSDVDLEQVTVQVKLTVLSNPEQAVDVVPLISQYANSQNKISGADLFANGKYHVEMEKLSRSEWAPATSGLGRGTRWYYERARGSYIVDKVRQGTPAKQKAWAEQHPLTQKFTKTDLAKYLHAWDGLPHLVCKGGDKNFQELADRLAEGPEPIVNQTYFRRVVAKAILWRTCEEIFESLKKDLKLKDYRANTVAYSVAWIAKESGRRIHLDHIWEKQKLGISLCEALQVLLKEVHGYITRLPGNQGESTKQERIWKDVQTIQFSLPSSWRTELAPAPYVDATKEGEVLELEWERIRNIHSIAISEKTLADMAAFTRRKAPSKLAKFRIYELAPYAALPLMEKRAIKRKDFKELVQIVAAYADLLSPTVKGGQHDEDESDGNEPL